MLKETDREFDAAYGETGRPDIPPEALLKAPSLQALYSIPSERRLVAAISRNLFYRWFCDSEPGGLRKVRHVGRSAQLAPSGPLGSSGTNGIGKRTQSATATRRSEKSTNPIGKLVFLPSIASAF